MYISSLSEIMEKKNQPASWRPFEVINFRIFLKLNLEFHFLKVIVQKKSKIKRAINV